MTREAIALVGLVGLVVAGGVLAAVAGAPWTDVAIGLGALGLWTVIAIPVAIGIGRRLASRQPPEPTEEDR